MLNALLTYSYGASGVMRREQADKRRYNNARSEKVLKAEKAMVDSWAPGANVIINESAFKDIKKHQSTQLNTFYTSQALSVSVVATPSDTSKNRSGA